MLNLEVIAVTMIRGAIKNIVSISNFKRGLAVKIFEDVKRSDAKSRCRL
ncbi:MAG: hypothetical protein RSE38_12595 [Acinetobacter sp.]